MVCFEAIKDLFELFGGALDWDGGSLGIFGYSVLNFLGVPDFNEFCDVGIVFVFGFGYEGVDVWLCFGGGGVILEYGEFRVDAGTVEEGVVDDGWGAFAVGGGGLSCINRGELDLRFCLVDVARCWGDQAFFFSG
ncbi:hypothetical protein FRC0129_00626 [Corynebacterium diphtheriae]|nr:hypothetical protein FRC0129_00626 [Corynebacterium diphtheriae]